MELFPRVCALMIAVAAAPALGQSTLPETAGSVSSAGPKSVSAEPPVTKPVLGPGVFARVNNRPVSYNEFHSVFSSYLRNKYYHGKVPDADLIAARGEVTKQIIDTILLREEALRRSIQPSAEEVQQLVDRFDQKNTNSPAWQRDRESVLPELRSEIEDQLRVKMLERQVRDAVTVSPEEVLAFYKAKPELFTEPEQLKMSAIVLGVDPSSTSEVWEAALTEAAAIVKRVRGGSDFAEIARVVSSDPSAAQGGQMDYVHKGMIPDGVHEVLAKLPLGELSEPIRILQGVGIFRVDARKEATLRDFVQVEERAKELLLREKRDQVWDAERAGLRSKAEVILAETAVAETGNPGAPGK